MTQPPAPPPPPGNPPPPGQPYPAPASPDWSAPPPSTGTGTAVLGVMNIVFALLCGCGTLPWNWMPEFFESGSQQSVEELKKGIQGTRIESSSGSGPIKTKESQEIPEEVAQKIAEGLKRGLTASANAPEMGDVALYARAALVLQIGLLLSGALLLARVRFARPLGILSCMGLVAVYVLGATATTSALDPFVDEMAPHIQDLRDLDSSQMEDPELTQALEQLQDHGASSLSWAFAGMFSIYPLIAGLILLLSRGIREHLQGPRPAYGPAAGGDGF